MKKATKPDLKVVKFKCVDEEHRDKAIATLEEFLKRAKKGEFNGIAVAATLPDGGISTRYNAANIWLLLGAVRQLENRILHNAE